jgi:prephenate dehydrogenase (NADP+)
MGAIVGGQTSVKAPEIAAFEHHLPADVDIVTFHSLHGPSVPPKGQPLVIVPHRATPKSVERVKHILSSLESKMVVLDSYQEHDRITADTQAVTHFAFLSMGTAWKTQGEFPWETPNYIGGIENVKVNMALRIYASKWHVYAGLALLNPSAHEQIQQYAKSVADLFTLMIQEREQEFRQRIERAKAFVFRDEQSSILLSDSVLNQFSLSAVPSNHAKPNSHLSLLAMVDCWYQLRVNPYDHLICQTPPFRLWLGIAEYCFKHLLEDAVQAALYDKDIRSEDLMFYSATQGWAQTVDLKNMQGYKKRFEDTAVFFEGRLQEAKQLSTAMISEIVKNTAQSHV